MTRTPSEPPSTAHPEWASADQRCRRPVRTRLDPLAGGARPSAPPRLSASPRRAPLPRCPRRHRDRRRRSVRAADCAGAGDPGAAGPRARQRRPGAAVARPRGGCHARAAQGGHVDRQGWRRRRRGSRLSMRPGWTRFGSCPLAWRGFGARDASIVAAGKRPVSTTAAKAKPQRGDPDESAKATGSSRGSQRSLGSAHGVARHGSVVTVRGARLCLSKPAAALARQRLRTLLDAE